MDKPRVTSALCVAALAVGGLAAGSAADASESPARTAAGCARMFDEAQRTDMESFRDFDSQTWRDGHAADAISIFPTGRMFVGIDEIMAGAARHFREKDAVWSWTELSRQVDGCRSAVIVYDATYDIPRFEYHQRALTVVTYRFEHGHWLSVMDQGTLLELTP
ncbi:hypothetical protein [Nocardioides speluncae]|uniref:hypothetical protein n=1 Tax=Nocardioides speluncae TaxID=2670337 RepID=UPI0012B16C4B|nr:hypothetical protein [Nocardioides speluncae]